MRIATLVIGLCISGAASAEPSNTIREIPVGSKFSFSTPLTFKARSHSVDLSALSSTDWKCKADLSGEVIGDKEYVLLPGDKLEVKALGYSQNRSSTAEFGCVLCNRPEFTLASARIPGAIIKLVCGNPHVEEYDIRIETFFNSFAGKLSLKKAPAINL